MPANVQWHVCTLTKQPCGAQFESSCVVCKRPVFFSDTAPPAAKKICWDCYRTKIQTEKNCETVGNEASLMRALLAKARN